MADESVETLRRRLEELERKISEFEDRLPPHSTKPSLMAELFELEEERDAVAAELRRQDHTGG